MDTSAPQQSFECFSLLFELLGAEFGQLPQVLELPADTGQCRQDAEPPEGSSPVDCGKMKSETCVRPHKTCSDCHRCFPNQ
jgi:hypothetical protein